MQTVTKMGMVSEALQKFVTYRVINIPANTTAPVRRGATAPANTTAPAKRGAATTLQEAQ